ncbi:MAG TPA: GntR family transcriptional regulator, partial [Chloroflexota bacterium]
HRGRRASMSRSSPFDPQHAEAFASAPAADAVYLALREAIVTGQLRPGDRLAEEQLARRFGVSRTPVREAILRLEAEHFARRLPRRGLVVRPILEKEVLEVYAVRAVLDGLAAALAAKEASPPDVARLRWINQQLAEAAERQEFRAMAALNIQFHEAICEAAHNGMLLHFVRQIHDWVRRFESTTLAHPGRAEAAIAEHERLLQAIEAGDAELAERLAREHMSNALQVRVAMLRASAAGGKAPRKK